MKSLTLRARRGFSLPEIILSMTLMLTVIGLSTQLFRKQSVAVSTQTGRLDAQQNSRFALSMLERELRVAGVNVVDQQPLLVMANTLGLSFNADLVALDTGDVASVYINPDADSASVMSMKMNDKITLPGTSTQYPDTNYWKNAGIYSEAETITYWLAKDTTSSYSYDYALFRRVNARPARLVARGIVYRGSSDVIFRYFKKDTLGNLIEISPALFPIIHTARIHGTQADTGKSALADSIREVEVQFTSVYHDKRASTDSTMRQLKLRIHLMNAGLLHHTTCGQAPIPPTAVTTTVSVANGTTVPQTRVNISWTKSTDDGGAEKDVERYAVYRRLSSATTFDEPIGSVPGAAVSFRDTDVLSGQSWVYAIASLDCTPATSTLAVSSAVVIP